MRGLKKIALVCCIAICTLLIASCSKDDEVIQEPQLTPSEVLANTAWEETTNAKNNRLNTVILIAKQK